MIRPPRAAPAVKSRILFVDDEPALLGGLQDMLYKDRQRWDMVFATSGARALDEFAKAPFDAVVSDMRMPGMDGASLLNRIKEAFPGTIRIMLSGNADREAIVRALPALHQLLSKPCDAVTLRHVLERSLDVEHGPRDARIRAAVSKIDRLPSPPMIYFDLAHVLESPSASLPDITSVVMRDPALSAKVLQLVNSAYYGAGQTTSSIAQAVGMLGTDGIRYIALTTSVFSFPDAEPVAGFSLRSIQESSERCAVLARSFLTGAAANDGFCSALLHHVGQIVLAIGMRAGYERVLARVATGEAQSRAELDELGASHAEVGAHLLAIWGIPPAIASIVAAHHDPGSAPPPARLIASAVHVASALTPGAGTPADIDLESLGRAGAAHLVPAWQAKAAQP